MTPCSICGRPLWDGGHAISKRECASPGGFECRLLAEIRRLRASRSSTSGPPLPPTTEDIRRALSPVESPGEERLRADLAEIERLVSKYGRAIVYGGNGLKALEARATLLSAIRSLRAPREVEEVREALRKVVADWRTRASARPQAHDPAITMDEAARWVIASTLRVCADDVEEAARLSSSSGEAPERGDGEGRS